MPNRIIKESICTSKGLSECSIFAEDLYKRLIVYADDYGRFNADTEIMLARLYPREIQYFTEDDIIEALIELAGIGKIAFYTAQPKKEVYGCLPNWKEHQRVRDSKSKCPDPDDTTVNDWYLRRFISIDMKERIIERDGFKCQICGKYLSTMRDAKRFAKLCGGMYHIDHIVPVVQGGRATEENLRLTCPACNLSRKKKFSMDEILHFHDSPQLAETCGEPQKLAPVIQTNPIQSESETESNARGAFEVFWQNYPKKVNKKDAEKAFKAVKVSIDVLIAAVDKQKASREWQKDGGQYIPYPATWLRRGGWENELAPVTAPTARQNAPTAEEYGEVRRLLEEL